MPPRSVCTLQRSTRKQSCRGGWLTFAGRVVAGGWVSRCVGGAGSAASADVATDVLVLGAGDGGAPASRVERVIPRSARAGRASSVAVRSASGARRDRGATRARYGACRSRTIRLNNWR
jgi:hypothetical protein